MSQTFVRGAAVVLLAIAALVVGALVYAVDRAPHSAYLLPRALLAGAGTAPWFGPFAASLPSYLHAFAFSLLTAVLVPSRLPAAAACCAFWWAVDTGFELAQHKAWSATIAEHLPVWFAGVPVLDHTANYLVRGTFDRLDLAAILAGCGSALAVLAARPGIASRTLT